MKKYEGPSIRKVETDCNKLPDKVGFPRTMQGVTRNIYRAKMKRTKTYKFGKVLFKGQTVIVEENGYGLTARINEDDALSFGVSKKDIEVN